MKQDKTLWYTAKKRRTQSRNYFRLGHWSPICATQYAVNFPEKKYDLHDLRDTGAAFYQLG